MTLDEIVRRNARRFPDKLALVLDERQLTWKQLDQRVDRAAAGLLQSGLTSGDRVALLLGNSLEYFEIYFACARAGLIAVPINYRLTAEETHQILAQADASLLISEADYAKTVSAVASLLPKAGRCWWLGQDPLNDGVAYERVLENAPAQAVRSCAKDTDTFAIFFTSGTTGLPKGAMVSHLNLEANAYNQFVADGSLSDDINLVSTPIYHMGAVFMAITYMMLGCTQVIVRQFTPMAWLRSLAESRATVSLLIPTMINAVLNEPEARGHDLSSLRLIFYGGGPMPPAVLARALETFSAGFTQGYGLTETLEATFLVSADHVPDGSDLQRQRLASAGREAVGAEVRIVDENVDDVSSGTVGEVLIKSRSVISGYWNNPDETARAIRAGWFHTGDLGYLDEDRYLFIIDRKKDMVVSGGVNIYTKEVESKLYTHPAVREAAVFGVPDDEWGEVVTAAVALKNNANATEQQLIEHCKHGLASFKKPKRIVFMDELPKNPSGKILKRELRRAFLG